jgi:YbbR domain-containing protein
MKFSGIIETFASRKFGLRLGAFGLAFLLWVFIVSSEIYEITITMPIEVRNLSEQKALREEVPKTADVRFEGRGRMLLKTIILNRFYKNFKLVLDLDRISDEYEFILNDYYREYPQKIVIPNEFDINYVEIQSPREIQIRLDEYAKRTIPIISQIVIKTAPGYVIVGNELIEPSEIQIAGPKEVVEGLTQLFTVSDTLQNVTIDVSDYFKFAIPHKQIQLSTQDVKISADIQALSERIISEVPVDVINIPSNYRVFVSPHTVSLTIIGGVEYIQSISSDDISMTIDFDRQWRSDIQYYEPMISVPGGIIDWQDLSPPNVELIITRENN